jgi:hypothetical protein
LAEPHDYSFVVELRQSYKNVASLCCSNQGLLQIYAWQKIINYATVKKRGRLQRLKEKVRCNVVSSVRYEEFSNQRTVSKDPAESRPAGARAGRNYYFSNREEGQHLMAFAETVI